MSIGIGGAGSKLASLLEPENATIVNVSQSELDKVEAKSKIMAVAHSSRGQFHGAGKNPEVGKAAYTSIQDEIYELIKGEVVLTSTGGGTGSGIVSVLLDQIAQKEEISLNDKTVFGLVLPYVERESAEFVQNTVDFLMGPVSNAIDSGNTGNILLFSNKLKFEGRIAEHDYNTMMIECFKNFLAIPHKSDRLELLDGHVDHEDFRVYQSKPYFNHFCQFEYDAHKPFADQVKENTSQVLLTPEQPIEAMFLLEVPSREMTAQFYDILDHFAEDHIAPAYGVVLNPDIQKPIITLSVLYSRKPKELVDDFCQRVERITKKKLKKTINQFVKLEKTQMNVEEEVRRIEEGEDAEKSVLDVLGRLKKLR